MYTQKIQVENIKCGGCINSIKRKLEKLFPIDNLEINLENGEISIESKEDIDVEVVIKTLTKMGYPSVGGGNGLLTAKSYVSCMIGRVKS